MSLNDTVSSQRIHIGFFGKRNAGKSSLLNAVTGQDLAVVSDVKGTTTDPVKKAMELLPLGPVVIIDTPGIDDEGELGLKRIEKAKETLSRVHIAVLVVDATDNLRTEDNFLIHLFKKQNIPYIIAYNKCDLLKNIPTVLAHNEIFVSAKENSGIFELKEKLGELGKNAGNKRRVVGDLIQKGDTVVLCIPIDESAPKGRIILPQQLVLRDCLDSGATAICCRDSELEGTLSKLKDPPAIVITDSQVFSEVSKTVSENVPLTSFSILMARYKGDLAMLCEGAKILGTIRDGDKILVSEGCTHHRQCNDIGTVKIPKWVREYTGANPEFAFTSGVEFPENLEEFKLVIHCGGCTLNEKEMAFRINRCRQQGISVVNYGIAIAQMNGILKRSTEMFEEIEL